VPGTSIVPLLIRSWKAFLETITATIAHFGIWMTVFGGLIAYSIQLYSGFFGSRTDAPCSASDDIAPHSKQKHTLIFMVLSIVGLLAQTTSETPLLDQMLLPQAIGMVKELQKIQGPRASVLVSLENHPTVTISTLSFPLGPCTNMQDRIS
jgi:hypothetical protein